jgi:hypothetical protein
METGVVEADTALAEENMARVIHIHCELCVVYEKYIVCYGCQILAATYADHNSLAVAA